MMLLIILRQRVRFNNFKKQEKMKNKNDILLLFYLKR